MSLHIGTSKFTEPSSVAMPRINSFFSKASKPVDQNERKDEICSTTDGPYDKNLTQEIDSKDSGCDKEPSLISKQSIKSYFSQEFKTLDVNNKQQAYVKTASSCDETLVRREGVSKQSRFDKNKRARHSGKIGRAHVWTPVTPISRMPSSAWKKKKTKQRTQRRQKIDSRA